MSTRRLSKETVAIINAIESATAGAKVIADVVAKELTTHTDHDDKRFAELTKLVESIASDVKSLIETRTFSRAVWWTITKIGGYVSVIAAGGWALYVYIAGRH